MPLPTRLIGVFAAIIILIVVLPMLFIGSYTVGTKKTESLGLSGLIEGIQKNYTIMIILVTIAITIAVAWIFVTLKVTPQS